MPCFSSGQVGIKWANSCLLELLKHISRTGNDIPEYASAEWHRADGSVHSGKVRIEKPKEMDKRERYVIQIDDDNKLSLSVEMPKPIPKIQ